MVAIVRNDGNAITIALAVTAVGATLFTTAPEASVQTLIERFAPLAPRMLVAHTMPRSFDTGSSITSAAAVVAALPSVTDVVYLDETPLPSTTVARQHELRELIADGDPARFEWRRFPFNQPLFITASPGATGRPECIVHGAGGTLVEHLKEHRLHGDLGPGDKLLFQTNCAWTMWHWQLSALASDVEIVTYDGPAADVDTFWRIAAEERVSVFGTNAPYLQMSEDARIEPGRQFDLSALCTIVSAGGVTYASQFGWVLEHVGALPLQCVSADADVMEAFVLGNPNLPVHAGEAQCRSLGLDVRAYCNGVDTSAKGELVCANPFPSRPLGFIGDEDGSRFHNAYFAANRGVWTAGDIIELLPHGSARLHGRSGGVLRVRGIGVSPGDIYRILLGFDEICQAVAVPRTVANPEVEGQGIILLIVLRVGVYLDAVLAARIRRELASQGSAALVPDVIAQVSELPVTLDDKLSEAAARDAVNGQAASNIASLRNPECLGEISAHLALAHTTRALSAPGESIDGIERYLCMLWERYFSYSPIGRDDNFFELGGHSLLAARMLADIEGATGRKLALDTLIVAPTIARLAAVIASEPRREVRSIMLVMRRAGGGRPIFMTHSVTGSVMESLKLAHVLQCARPIFGFQVQGLEGEAEPLASVEAMAQSYVQRLRTLQPQGPYALVGYSFGVLVAYEMAQQLVAAGERIEMLCLMDTYVHEQCGLRVTQIEGRHNDLLVEPLVVTVAEVLGSGLAEA
ncbi:Acetoacetyl-CoA synthetase [Candidatus Paraburkholderia schumanniana]|nr:Acetoacetyl-CoA synthetase [Candidatus Paraburkholderia schumannianae]